MAPARRDGHIRAGGVLEAIRPDTTLVSMMAVNNEVGTILPVEAAARAIARRKRRPCSMWTRCRRLASSATKPEQKWIDLMSISAHKIHGPKGVGALYVRKGIRIEPHSFGGGQERGIRPGTEALPAIGGFGAAVEALPAVGES